MPDTMATDVRPPMWLSLSVAAACLVALGDWPYGYYQLLRVVVTVYAVWIAFHWSARSRTAWPWAFGFLAILYNPLVKISMSRDVHAVENIVTAIVIIAEMVRARRAGAAHSAR